jgi:hypothetical protein
VARQVDAPPAGSLDTSTRPAASVAAQRLRHAHEIDVSDTRSILIARHAVEPPLGRLVTRTSPLDVVTQNETVGHEIALRVPLRGATVLTPPDSVQTSPSRPTATQREALGHATPWNSS